MWRFRFSLVLLLIAYSAGAQYGNEWIVGGQPYYKIKTGKNGIFRLTYSNLQAAGFPLTGLDPRNLQLFHRGTEQSILVQGEVDGSFDPNDFVEFYGQKNDGTLDKQLYSPAEAQPHSYTNLFSDTTAYFLTVGNVAGKRMEVISESDPGLLPEPYHWHEASLFFFEQYSPGRTLAAYLRNSAFEDGEGWTANPVRDGVTRDYTLSGLNGIVSTGKSEVELLVAGRSQSDHPFQIFVGPSASQLRLLGSYNVNEFGVIRIKEPLNATDISEAGQLVVRLAPQVTTVSLHYVSPSYIKVMAAQETRMFGQAEKFFVLTPSDQGTSRVDLSELPANSRMFDITSPDQVRLIPMSSGSAAQVIVPGTDVSRRLLVTSSFTEPVIRRVHMPEIPRGTADYIIITHPRLRTAGGGYADPVEAFAAYRASQAGGGYDTLIVEMPDLYNLFSYGEYSPVSIRRFLQWTSQVKVPDYLFLVGKGLDVTINYWRRPQNFPNYQDLVPSSGYPASDMNYSTGIAGSGYEPAIPTGRLTAMTADQVANYLDKVIATESQPFNSLRRKNLLHLSGGINAGEPQLFKFIMQGFQSTAEAPYLGGKVSAVAKQSTELEFINIADEVNEGLNLVTFFGHSAPGTIDLDIGFATDPVLNYNNKDKYPFFLINGCNAGAFFLYNFLFGEDWVLAKDKGAIGFIAHSGYGLAYTLRKYSEYFYEVAYGDSIFMTKGVGDIQQEVARRYMADTNPTIDNVSQVQQMVLLGDPAVRVFGAAKPDYAIEPTDVFTESFDGNPITMQTDSFALHIIIRNYGQARTDSLTLRVERVFEDQSAIVYDTLIPPVYYSDTLMLTMKRPRNSQGGVNQFNVKIDSYELMSELSESNNEVTLEYFVARNATRNLFPYDHAIVNDNETLLRFQSTDVGTGERTFLLEIDTVQTFDSPFVQRHDVSGRVLAIQPVSLLAWDSLVYYWRTRLKDPLPDESEDWAWSSFVFVDAGNEGWAQSDFAQYLKNKAEGLFVDTEAEELRYLETVSDVAIRTFGSGVSASNLDVSIKLNGAEYQLKSTGVTQRVPCRNNTINLIAFNRVTTVPYAAIDYGFANPRGCGREPKVIGSFLASELEIAGLGIADYINKIEAGDSVVVFSIGNVNYSTWSANVRAALDQLGISTTQINSLVPGEPVVIFSRKGGLSGSAQIQRSDVAPPTAQWLTATGTITGRYTQGKMTTPLIGPSSEWKALSYRAVNVEPQDEFRVIVTGVGLDGAETELMSQATENANLQTIDAATYPYLRLHFETEDELKLTSPQLDQWFVEYEPVAEGILIYEREDESVKLAEGMVYTGDFGFVNISDRTFSDSLLVRYELFNLETRQPDLVAKRIKAPLPGDTTHFQVSLSTTGNTGLNDLNVFVNPRILPEQHYENNLLNLQRHIEVMRDPLRPVLDVVFDGRHLQNGDGVSPDPVIDVYVWDENPYIRITDTLNTRLYLRYPCAASDCPFQPVYFSNPAIGWEPAAATENFHVRYTPMLLPGEYALRIESYDARGNAAGDNPYEVSFVVSTDQKVVWGAPFPNPASAFITFSLFVGGTEAPDQLILEITGSDGRQVKSLTAQNLHVGTNELIWNLTDEAGNQTPSGVYLYRIQLMNGSQAIPVTVPFGSTYLNNGNGKLVIVR